MGVGFFSDDDDGKKYSRNVIVVGHSMGGLVAKYAAEQVVVNTDKKKKKKKKNRRIEHVHVTTLATPHAYHPGAFALSSFVNHAWWKRTSKKKSEREKSSISLMSVSGGIRDWQVSGVDASLVLPSNDSDNDRNRNSERVKVVSTRTSCDHLMICWCKQVILSLSVALQRMAKSGEKRRFGQYFSIHRGYKRRYSAAFGLAMALKTHLRGKKTMASSSMDFLKTIILPTKELEFGIRWRPSLSRERRMLRLPQSFGMFYSPPRCRH